ncbi:M48 family metallopeptidase [Paracoccus sp. TK19116]|uniref:M48 family metallopeptidase n=1 Tax=Paracoccus albicereus TaxID=2922394 RepID=A0ABT1MVR2_9RHOB|nr:SprT family zinc-dependent metalloprotease [Paracoccus albicereus]MCQ0971764.1 M48 family metallopeptidase [Paracoccus albicereus]
MPDQITLRNGIPVSLRRSARARRMVLRVARTDGAVMLTLPGRASLAEAQAFVETKAGWVERVRANLPAAQVVAPGAVLPVEGRDLILTPASVRSAAIDGPNLLIPHGRPAGPVVAAFLKHLAQARLAPACDRHAEALGRGFSAIALRDTRSRWGSCTSAGRLMFSWRLAMAPHPVLDYVAAHEVAHLAHMDHSPRFWATVARLCPDHARQRGWLRQHGPSVQAWRFRD